MFESMMEENITSKFRDECILIQEFLFSEFHRLYLKYMKIHSIPMLFLLLLPLLSPSHHPKKTMRIVIFANATKVCEWFSVSSQSIFSSRPAAAPLFFFFPLEDSNLYIKDTMTSYENPVPPPPIPFLLCPSVCLSQPVVT